MATATTASSNRHSIVTKMKNPKTAEDLETIMGNIVKAVLTTRPLSILRFIADFLENELTKRSLLEIQASADKKVMPAKLEDHRVHELAKKISQRAIEKAVTDVKVEEKASELQDTDDSTPEKLQSEAAMEESSGTETTCDAQWEIVDEKISANLEHADYVCQKEEASCASVTEASPVHTETIAVCAIEVERTETPAYSDLEEFTQDIADGMRKDVVTPVEVHDVARPHPQEAVKLEESEDVLEKNRQDKVSCDVSEGQISKQLAEDKGVNQVIEQSSVPGPDDVNEEKVAEDAEAIDTVQEKLPESKPDEAYVKAEQPPKELIEKEMTDESDTADKKDAAPEEVTENTDITKQELIQGEQPEVAKDKSGESTEPETEKDISEKAETAREVMESEPTEDVIDPKLDNSQEEPFEQEECTVNSSQQLSEKAVTKPTVAIAHNNDSTPTYATEAETKEDIQVSEQTCAQEQEIIECKPVDAINNTEESSAKSETEQIIENDTVELKNTEEETESQPSVNHAEDVKYENAQDEELIKNLSGNSKDKNEEPPAVPVVTEEPAENDASGSKVSKSDKKAEMTKSDINSESDQKEQQVLTEINQPTLQTEETDSSLEAEKELQGTPNCEMPTDETPKENELEMKISKNRSELDTLSSKEEAEATVDVEEKNLQGTPSDTDIQESTIEQELILSNDVIPEVKSEKGNISTQDESAAEVGHDVVNEQENNEKQITDTQEADTAPSNKEQSDNVRDEEFTEQTGGDIFKSQPAGEFVEPSAFENLSSEVPVSATTPTENPFPQSAQDGTVIAEHTSEQSDSLVVASGEAATAEPTE